MRQRHRDAPDAVQQGGDGRWHVYRAEARGTSNGSGRTRDAAMVAWRNDVRRRRAAGEEVGPAYFDRGAS